MLTSGVLLTVLEIKRYIPRGKILLDLALTLLKVKVQDHCKNPCMIDQPWIKKIAVSQILAYGCIY